MPFASSNPNAMTRPLQYAAFLIGLVAIAWVGFGYIGSNTLALMITSIVAGFYVVGGFELQRFQRATSTLAQALSGLQQAPAKLAIWLDTLPPSLQNAVRLRIEGERVGLPSPALTPYLAGLLVLLGMLGTFLGMVVTLNGTGIALDSASDVQAIRASLSAPVKGLGLAFGTSIAGVAASAMLGLVSALCRRDRLLAAQVLDTRIATTLRVFSKAHRRDEAFKLLQQQAAAMPEVVVRLQDMMAAMERQSLALNERLIANQNHFHGKAEAAYAGLASSVDRSLKESLVEGARVAGATIQPVVTATMASIAREATALHDTIAQAAEGRLDAMSTRFEATTGKVADLLTQHSSSLLRTVGDAHAHLQVEMASSDQQRLAAWTNALQAMANSLQREVAQFMHVASDAPRAAAEVIAELRQTHSEGMVRDNATLEERSRTLETLRHVLDAVGAQTGKMTAVTAQITGSAVEVASLGESFGVAVQLFSESNQKLGAQLERVESAFSKSAARSDEQLAYYVAQAREVIDLSILSQKQIVEDLQRLAARRTTESNEA
jgi:hypothetical protein